MEREDYTGLRFGRALESRGVFASPPFLLAMTQRVSPLTEMLPKPFVPAWLISIAFHVSLIVILALTIQSAPRGGAERHGGSLGIVLTSGSGEGDLFDGEDGANNAGAAAEEWPPTDILSVLPNEPATPNVSPIAPSEQTADAEAINASSAFGTPPPANAAPIAGSGQPGAGKLNSGGGGRGSPGGGNARVSVFGVQGEGKKFLYLFDRSSSMDGAPLAAAKRQLLESLSALESMHQFHIIFFNTKTLSFEVTGGGRRIAFADDRNKQLAANFVGGVTADGGTDRLTALREAIRFAPDVIFFLTDADDPMAPSELADIARENGRAQATICVIEFGRRQSPLPGNFLAELARQSGGQYGYVNTTTLTK
jgi:hypothetical protein